MDARRAPADEATRPYLMRLGSAALPHLDDTERLSNRVMAFSDGGHTLIGEWRWDGMLIKRPTVYVVATGQWVGDW